MIWPAPERAILRFRTGSAWLDLPVRSPSDADGDLPEFEPPFAAPGTQPRKIRAMDMQRKLEIDFTTNEIVYTLRGDGGEFGGASLARLEEIDLDLGYTQMKRYRILEDDPLSAEMEFVQSAVLQRADWRVRVESRSRLRSTATTFAFTCDLEAFEADKPVAARNWTVSIPRRLL